MRSRFVAPISLAIVLLISSVGHTDGQQAPPQAPPVVRADGTSPTPISEMTAEEELWPLLPPSAKAYGTIDGRHLKTYVEELAAISRKSRDRGDRYWGRIAGAPSHDEAQEWTAAKLRKAGLDVTMPVLELRPQWFATSWDLSVAGGSQTINLKSAAPVWRSAPAPAGGMELETVWVGLGMASDFVGKDVRGKAVFVYSILTPGGYSHSASWADSVKRAREGGAAAIVVVMPLAGNPMFMTFAGGGTQGQGLPMFMIGQEDGVAVESLMAASGTGRAPTTRLHLDTKFVPGLKTTNVVGVLPGMTDENIVVIGHADGFYEGANDNGAGMATMLGLAEYFAKIPKAQRRRTMYFVSSPHHIGAVKTDWLHDNLQPVFAKTALIVNPEHNAAMQPYYNSDHPPKLVPSNAVAASWFGVNGSERLAATIVKNFALFGVPTELEPGGSPGGLRYIQYDAPSVFLHNKGAYYHSSLDTADIVPASALQTSVQAFAKIFDDINKLDLKDLRPTAARTNTSR